MVERFTAPSAGRGSPVQLLPTGRESGEWVRHSDYAELEAEVERLRKKNEYLEDRNEECEHWRIHWKTKAFEAISRTGAVKVLEAELGWYSRTEHGALDGIPYKHVAHVIRVMLSRLSALEPPAPEGQQEAARIGDAVLDWMTKYDLLDGEQEYYVADVIAVLDDLTPLTRPSEQAVTEAMKRIRDYADKAHADRYVIRDMAEKALKAAMEAGR